jgi:Tfp pilus assembly protein PilN
MINLLPDNEKKNVNDQYRLRRLVLWLLGVLAIFIMIIVLMVPLYIIARYKSSAAVAAGQIPALAMVTSEEAALQREVENSKLLLEILKPDTTTIVPSDIIPVLIKDQTDQNAITSIIFSIEPQSTSTIQVRGIAKTRESLSAFTKALEKEPFITKVDVPVSNFAKDANIEFSFTITAKK